LSASEPASELVTLKAGLVVPVEALRLAWSLEDRGATFALEGSELVVDAPSAVLTHADRNAIRRWRAHLIAIVGYRPPEEEFRQ
jgi:hypothetical protein